METKKLLGVALGAMLLCPAMNATLKSFGMTVIKKPGTSIVVAGGELLGVSGLVTGLGGAVLGCKKAGVATLKIALNVAREVAGKATMTTEELSKQWKAVVDGVGNMVFGGGMLGLSLMEMAWCASFLAGDNSVKKTDVVSE